MIVLMGIKLYTSRVVLEYLGITNFGVWNAITTFIIAFNFISMPLVSAIQRFLNFEMGLNTKRLKETWSASFFICSILSIILLLLLESVGLWFINTKMNFDHTSMYVVNFVYQMSLVSVLIGLIRLPFEASIIAHERMSAYSVLCILETILLLLIVFLLKFDLLDNRLIFYSILYVFAQIIILFAFVIYSYKKFTCVRIVRHINIPLIKEIGKYSSWNFLGAIASMSASSGLNVLLNIYFGVVVNAAYAITMQVSNALNQLNKNLMTALNPQLVKSYAAENFDRVFSLSINGCKFSFLLLLLPLFPLWYNIDFILYLWLGDNVPLQTPNFCRIYFIYLLIASFATPLATTALASQDIKKYQLTLFPIVCLNIVFSYIALKYGGPAKTVFLVRILVEVLILSYRLWYLKLKIHFPITKFLLKTIFPLSSIILLIIGIFTLFTIFSNQYQISQLQTLILSSSIFICCYIPCCWFLGIPKSTRSSILTFLKSHIH